MGRGDDWSVTQVRSLDFLGKVIRGLRNACGLRQEDLGEMTGLHPIVISRIETGAARCAPDSLYKFASGLGLRPSTLVFMSEEFARTEGLLLADVKQMSSRFETIEGYGSWQAFVRRMTLHRVLTPAEA